MEKENTIGFLVAVLAVLTLIILNALFNGTPDLVDAILYNLTGGKIPLPTE